MARCVMMRVDERKVLVRIEADMAQGAPVVLSLQQRQAHRRVHDLRHASLLPDLPVVPVVRIERTALSLELAVAGDRDVVLPCEPGFAIREVPVGVEVSRSDPRRRLYRMSAFGPAPQLRLDMVIHGMERLLRRTMPVIVRPTPDERVELADDLAGGGLPMFAQIVMDGAQML